MSGEGTAAVAATSETAAVTTATVTAPDVSWMDKLDDGLKGFAANKGHHKLDGISAYKTLAASYQEAEKALKSPAERVLRIPAPDAPTEEWNAYHTKLGRPAKAEDYTFETGDDGDKPFADYLRTKAFERGLPKDKAEGIWKDFVEWGTKAESDAADARKAALTTETAELEKQWGKGSDFQAKKLVAMRAAKSAGVTEEQFEEAAKKPGFSQAYNLFLHFGQKMGEDKFIPGGITGQNLYTRQQAADRMKALKADPTWAQKWLSGDVAAREEFRNLGKIAQPEGELQKAA